MRQLDLGALVAGRGEEDQREATLLVFEAAGLLQPESSKNAIVLAGSVTRIIVCRYFMDGLFGLDRR